VGLVSRDDTEGDGFPVVSKTNSNCRLSSCSFLNVTHHSGWCVGLMLC